MDRFSKLRGFGAFLPFVLLNIIEYAIEHIRYLIYDSLLVGEAFEVIMTLFGSAVDILEAIIPVAIGAVMLLVLADAGLRASLITGGCLVLSRFFYLLPHYYMSNIFSGYDSLESIGLGALASLGIMLLFTLELAVCVLLALTPSLLRARRTREGVREILLSALDKHEPFDVGNKVTAYVGIFALLIFVKMFSIVTADVISVLIKYSGTYPSRLLLPTVLEYGFAIIILILAHFLGLQIIKRLNKSSNEINEGDTQK